MDSLKFGFACLLLLTLSKLADAALDTGCSLDTDCDTGEVCDAGGIDVCICDDDNSYSQGPTNTNFCFLAKNIGDTCAANDECELGDGAGDGAVCHSTTCVAPKNLGDACTGNSQCEAGAGGAGTVCDSDDDNTCKKDCGVPDNPLGYTLTASSGTLQGDSATAACGTGFTEDTPGTPPAAIRCQSDGSWPLPSGCGPVDCGSPTAPSNGAVQEPGAGTHYGQQATYSCDSGYTLSGSAQVRCQADRTWETAPTCVVGGNGARQTFSFVILTGSLIIALILNTKRSS